MNIIKKLLREGLLTEIASGKHLIVVDVQPEYERGFGQLAHNLFKYINKNYDSFYDVTFLYNGESMGMISENEYRYWLTEMGLKEEIAFDVRMFDKGYAFFRSCMGKGIDEDSIVNLVKYMYNNDVNMSTDLDEEFWNEFVDEYGDEDIRELMENNDDFINIPDLMDFLKYSDNIVLVGGHTEECLKEVEIALDALDKNYQTWNKFTY